MVLLLGLSQGNDIVDELLAGIRRSHFLIADFIGQNRGVYYEAGFARGLGKNVIQFCREDQFSDSSDGAKRMHFDNSQINAIVWRSGEEVELKGKITARVEAIFGHGDYVPKEP